jgi:hypothetical protein
MTTNYQALRSMEQKRIELMKKASRVNAYAPNIGIVPTLLSTKQKLACNAFTIDEPVTVAKPNNVKPPTHSYLLDPECYRTGMGETQTYIRAGSDRPYSLPSKGI